MRFCVTCVYWTLLLVSVVSSGLLFLIVATEGVQAKRHATPLPRNENVKTYSNVTLDAEGADNLELSNVAIMEPQNVITPKDSQEDQSDPKDEVAAVSSSFETFIGEETPKEKDIAVHAESLTQQPNLSQGISETGQAVVLTLVDTAAAELQSLTESRISSEFRSTSGTKNSTSATSTVTRRQERLGEATPTTQIPAPPVSDEATEHLNVTDDLDDKEILFVENSIVEDNPEVVVIVRAEQKITTDSIESRTDDEIVQVVPEELPKVDDTFSTAPELNDSAARARLVSSGNRDEAAVILDGLVTSGPTDPHEDIPSFSEWAQKRLEEAEKKKTHPNASVQTPGGPGRGLGGMKMRSKNYASPDCGAKVVAVNPEARSAKSVLVSTRDEYMLNTCTSRIWFVVELCEAIQAKKIELANFELFSSSPKDFLVYVSDRFPTRDWSPVGQFTAKDEKGIQSFTLHPHLFGKFIKVEVQSHHGSEHFCPISLFRAYGTSEFEVLETETENQVPREPTSDSEDDEEEEVDDSGEPPRNLFGSARDAVLSIVKKAAEVLVKSSDLSGNNITEIQQSIDSGTILDHHSYVSCTTPRFTILCSNCSDQKFAKVFQLVSCRNKQLDELLKVKLLNETLRSRLCGLYGIDVGSANGTEDEEIKAETKRETTEWTDPIENLRSNFFASLFKPEYIIALCNVLATKERKVVMNTSREIPVNISDTSKEKESIIDTNISIDQTSDITSTYQQASSTLNASSSTASRDNRKRTQEISSEETPTVNIEAQPINEGLALQIKPTKTLSKEDLKKEFAPTLEPTKEPAEEPFQAEIVTSVPPLPNTATVTTKLPEENPVLGTPAETTVKSISSSQVATHESQESTDSHGIEFESLEINLPSKDKEKLEQPEPDNKGKLDLGEQDKMSPDHIAFDTLLSDLKDLEGDAVNLQNGPGGGAASMQPATSNTPQQKESVFLRLSNRIKALERNMSLSGQYLEELSRRYKKQVEEMQRSLERAVSAMGEESRKREEREAKRIEEIAALHEQVILLTKSVESLLYDRDSWRSRVSTMGQHALLICLDVVVVVLILSYCRGIFFGEQQPIIVKKTKKRRPSEIASHISGSYHELMIDDRPQDTKKERKKKRKKESVAMNANYEAKREASRFKSTLSSVPGGTNLPSRRASSIDAPTANSDIQYSSQKRPESAPDTSIDWFEDQIQKKERHPQFVLTGKESEVNSEKSLDLGYVLDEISESNSSSTNVDKSSASATMEQGTVSSKNNSTKGGILKNTRLSSPLFMKTALSSRKSRKVSNSDHSSQNKSDHVENQSSYSRDSPTGLRIFTGRISGANGGTNGLIDESDQSRSSSVTPTSGKKEKKSTGLRKMVRKLF